MSKGFAMILKIVVVVLLLFIFLSLIRGLVHLVRGEGSEEKMLVVLSWRLGLSFVVFGLLVLGYYLGWIVPHGIQ